MVKWKCRLYYIFLGHTATEEGFTNAENVHLVRLMQSYHIESRKWDDIAYNFLIGKLLKTMY